MRFSRSSDSAKVGNWWQLAGVQRSLLRGGRAEGVEALDFRTGGGLRLQILAGRAMDIGLAEYKGAPLCWLSPAGVVHPSYFRERGAGFLESACGGLMFTCGLTQVGPPCEDKGERLGMHGRIANQPARQVRCGAGWEGGEFVIRAEGRVEEMLPFERRLSLRRKYRASLGEAGFTIRDSVRNEGPARAPHMILYHFNFGYPLVDEGTQVALPSESVRERGSPAQPGRGWKRAEAPSQGFSERVFYHSLKRSLEGFARAGLINDRLGIGVVLTYDAQALPRFVQWMCLNDRVYAIGLEPANCLPEGRAAQRESGALELLEPGDERNYEIRFEVVEGADRLAELRRRILEGHDG